MPGPETTDNLKEKDEEQEEEDRILVERGEKYGIETSLGDVEFTLNFDLLESDLLDDGTFKFSLCSIPHYDRRYGDCDAEELEKENRRWTITRGANLLDELFVFLYVRFRWRDDTDQLFLMIQLSDENFGFPEYKCHRVAAAAVSAKTEILG